MYQALNDILNQLDEYSFSNILPKDIYNILLSEMNKYIFTPRTTNVTVVNNTHPIEIQMFVISKRIEGCSKETLNRYNTYLTRFFTYTNLPLNKITLNHIRMYLLYEQEKHTISNYTIDVYRRVIQSFFTWCKNENVIQKNPAENLKPIKYAKYTKQALSNIELENIRNAYTNVREKAIFEFLYSTGCKVSEAISVNINDIDFDKQTVTIRNQPRQVFLNATAVLALKQYLMSRTDDNNALFVSGLKPYNRLCDYSIEVIMNKLGKHANLQRSLFPQLIRHTVFTTVLKYGMNLSSAQKMLGHEDICTTVKYALAYKNIQQQHTRYVN